MEYHAKLHKVHISIHLFLALLQKVPHHVLPCEKFKPH